MMVLLIATPPLKFLRDVFIIFMADIFRYVSIHLLVLQL